MGNNSNNSNSLIPIKGISQAQKRALSTKCQIYDIPGLLTQCKTAEQRAAIATKLNISKNEVNNWVKQADLWRVSGMTPDYAYLLVLAGIRSVADLAKVDVEKTLAVLRPIANAHYGLDYDPNILVTLVLNASLLEASSLSYSYLEDKLSELLEIGTGSGRKQNPNNISEAVKRLCSANGGADRLVIDDEPEPTYLFDEGAIDTSLGKSESEIIEEGLGFLQDINISLPLPHIISGVVKYRSEAASTGRARTGSAVAGLLVELKGIVNPSEEAVEGKAAVTTYTDGTGYFSMIMPDKYSMEDSLEFTFSDGGYKQKFVKQASELIENTVIKNGAKDENGKPLAANKLIAYFDKLEACNKEIKQYENEKKLLERRDSLQSKNERTEQEENQLKKYNDAIIDADITLSVSDLTKEIKNAKDDRKEYLKKIYGADPTTNNVEKTLTNLLARTDLEVCFDGDEDDENCTNKCFVIIEEVFKNYKDVQPRVLPSVKLMGEGDTATWLPTDCAPSQTYNYSMLQRLVEPAVYPPVGAVDKDGRHQREKMEKPVDVSGFKEQMMVNPEQIPKMSSLGIGYSLNMHQAWVPDGFALGTLLYSLILAPGEEQRIVVREHNESYEIIDNMEGSDETRESTSRSQSDDIQALYDYVLAQESKASSSSKYKSSSWSIGGSGSGGYGGFSLGLSGGYSKSSGSSSTSARQTNNHNETSSAAQSFNQQFSTAASMMAKSRRVSIRTASSTESDSVATKIIANHNHSHAMTVQYWEVVRRYRLDTSIDSVDLILFVPLELVRFLPKGQSLHCAYGNNFTKEVFNKRYEVLIRYNNILRNVLPYKYRGGLDLIQKYAALPNWSLENISANPTVIDITLEAAVFEFDSFSAKMYFTNGQGSISATVYYDAPIKIPNTYESTDALKDYIRSVRNKTLNNTSTEKRKIKFSFTLPYGTIEADISHISISHSCRDFEYVLANNAAYKTYKDNYGDDIDFNKALEKYYDKKYDAEKDQKNTVEDLGKMNYYGNQFPEAVLSPVSHLTAYVLQGLGSVQFEITSCSNSLIQIDQSSNSVDRYLAININVKYKALRYNEFLKMEETLQHVACETLNYSQKIWQTLSSDELAIMLERYNIDMNFKTYFEVDDDKTYIPLLNCVNVKRRIGYYGNCVLLPFTYPQQLADKLGKTAGEIQDALYRYHTSCFRAPSTTISIPTDGMIGEAVLSSTNVSEKIDLTRFWNWKDSPIDSMELDSSYFSNGNYLGDKNTKDITALNLQTAAQQTPVTAPDLISALVAKQTPTFDNITGLEQTAALLTNAMNTTAAGRDNVINKSSDLLSKALEYAAKKTSAKPNDSKPDSDKPESDKPEGEKPGEEKPGQENPEGPKPEGEKPGEEKPDGDKPIEEKPGEEKPEDDKNDNDLLASILEGAVSAIKHGDSPEKFFSDLTGANSDIKDIANVAEKFCSWLGTDLSSIVGNIVK